MNYEIFPDFFPATMYDRLYEKSNNLTVIGTDDPRNKVGSPIQILSPITSKISITDDEREHINQKMGTNISDNILPLKVYYEDTPKHKDVLLGGEKFNYSHLIYLSVPAGKFHVGDNRVDCVNNMGIKFNEGEMHQFVGEDQKKMRMMIGPFAETGLRVGDPYRERKLVVKNDVGIGNAMWLRYNGCSTLSLQYEYAVYKNGTVTGSRTLEPGDEVRMALCGSDTWYIQIMDNPIISIRNPTTAPTWRDLDSNASAEDLFGYYDNGRVDYATGRRVCGSDCSDWFVFKREPWNR